MCKILKRVFLRNAKKQNLMILLTVLGFIVSISLLTVIQMVTVGRSSYAKDNGRVLNHGDLSINFMFDKVNDINSQQSSRLQLLNYLQTLENIDFTYECIYKNQGNFCYVNSDAYVSESPILRFINIDDIDFFTKEIKNSLLPDEVVLARNLTNRMPAKAGDTIYISPGSEVFPLQLKIAGIVSDNEVFIQDAVENSYIYLDKSALYRYLQITDEKLQKFGYTQETYLLILPTVFYINADDDVLSEIQNMADYICEINGISNNNYSFGRPADAVSQVKKIYGNMDIILSVFTILSFLLSCCSILYLVYMIIFNDISDINILKIYGLSRKKCAIIIFLEVIFFLSPAIILGIIIGFINMKFIISGTSLYGIMNLGSKELLFSIMNIVLVAMSSIALITIPLVYFANRIRITDTLRQQNSGILLKKQVCGIAALISLWVIVIFSYITNAKIAATLLGIILGVVLIVFMLSFFVIFIFSLFNFKGVYGLSQNFIRKNKLKVALLTVPVSLAILCIFVVITCNYTLLNQADQTIENIKGYNMQIMTTNNGSELLEEYLKDEKISLYFSKYDSACTVIEINDNASKVETSISYYDKVPMIADMQYLKRGVIVDINVANNAKLKVGDILKLETPYGIIENEVSSIYHGGMKSDFSIAVYTENMTNNKDFRTYYLNLSKGEENKLKNFVDINDEMIIVSPSKMIFGMAVLFLNNKFLLNLLTFYFLLGTIIVVIYCTMIIYKGRVPSFGIYKAYGANAKIINKIVMLECAFMGIIISVCGLVLALGITFLISQYSLPIGINVPLLFFIIALVNIITFGAAKASLHSLKLKDISISDMLRRQE